MEAAWISAIIFAPLFFNKFSSRIFEPDKATLIRSLALLILAAWIAKFFDQEVSSTKSLIKKPLIIPVLIFSFIYLLSTVFSVAPRISFWGSYVRLQGFYTTISYIVIFGALVTNLRKKSQVDRLITTIILTSLPISLYGILQHAGRDPIPWGGDVTHRVASNMGNSIFVAAYLIMVFPLTLGKIVDAFSSILKEENNLFRHFARSTVYIFIASLQLITIFYSGSRGPWLGLLAGGFFLVVLLTIHWRKRWMTFTTIGLAIIIGVGLILLNIPNGPLQPLRQISSLERLGQLIDLESRTAKVRVLIWKGAADMVSPHDPITYPDGHTDTLNAIRPLIGYGPETMHMAYNPFYPPELAHVEKRNASPDRSHNETWDALVFTGLFGLIAYLLIFSSIFYFGLKWLGLIKGKVQHILFFSMFIGGGIISAIGFMLWQGKAFFGVGLPIGMILGLTLYFALSAMMQKSENIQNTEHNSRNITIIVLLSAIVAHFVEIHFGIAIVSTRTHFWVYSALLLLVGLILPETREYVIHQKETVGINKPKPKRKSRKKKRTPKINISENRQYTPIINGIIASILLIPLNYEFISNLWGERNGFKIFWNSFTHIDQQTISFGVLALIITAWLAANIVFTSETDTESSNISWWKNFGISSSLSIFISLLYGLWFSHSLGALARKTPNTMTDVINQTKSMEGLLTQFYFFAFLLICGLAFMFYSQHPSHKTSTKTHSYFVFPLLLIVSFWLINSTNLRIIHADIAFKTAEPFANHNQWPVAINLYQRAKSLAPDEDYYDLFLGRAYLEEAKLANDPSQKEQIFLQAEEDLKHAQSINPLNPDHTANLARLYSWWASQAQDDKEKKQRALISSHYYETVLKLSPNNARLWNEWAILNLNTLKNLDKAYEILVTSLNIDDQYDWTHAIMGDYYSISANNIDEETEKIPYLEKAAKEYSLAISTANERTLKSEQGLNYFLVLSNVYQRIGENNKAIETLEESLKYTNDPNKIWRIEESLSQIYYNNQEITNAILHIENALIYAPEDQRQRLQSLLNKLQQEY